MMSTVYKDLRDASHCPVTGLPLRRFEETISERGGKIVFRHEYFLVGDSILYSRYWGRNEAADARLMLGRLDRILAEHIPPGGRISIIEDCADFISSGRDVQMIYSRYLGASTRIDAVIFCGVGTFVAWAIRLGRMMITPHFLLTVVADYDAAIHVARGDHAGLHDVHEAENAVAHRLVSLASPREWVDDFDGFSLRIVLEGSDVMCVAWVGAFRPQHVTPSFDRISKIVSDFSPIYVMYDWTGLFHVDRGAARSFVDIFNTVYPSMTARLTVVYGMNGPLTILFSLYRLFSAYRLDTARTREEAEAKINRDRRTDRRELPAAPYSEPPGDPLLDSMLAFMSKIQFNRPGLPDFGENLPEGSPLRYLHDSIAMLKLDFDAVYAEKSSSEARLSTLLNNLPFAAWLEDFRRNVIASNTLFVELSRDRKDSVIGRDIAELLPESLGESYVAHVKQAAASGAVQTFEMSLDTERWFECIVTPIFGEKGVYIGTAACARDISERKHGEVELIAARKAAEDDNAMKARFLANISNELRTPMNSVVGLAAMLARTELSVEQRECVQIVGGSAQALLVIVGDILDFGRIEAGLLTCERSTFPLCLPAQSTVADFCMQAQEKGLAISCLVEDDVPREGLGDPDRIRQILRHLVSNAIKFTEAGSVGIRLSAVPVVGDAAPRMHISVSDTGTGIAAETVAQLFLPFVQADGSLTRRYGGAGLGLALSLELAHLMGGDIFVESRVGEGSVFTLELPVR